MKALILNGSPKGDISVTMQYMNLIRKKIEKADYETINISHEILKIESVEEYFEEIINKMEKAELIVWAFPVYHFLVPAQYKRFVELIEERGKEEILKDKYATTFTTSIHFYDTFAENYIQGISEDFGMRYIKGYLADMNDMKAAEKREDILTWFETVLEKTEKEVTGIARYRRSQKEIGEYKTSEIKNLPKTENYNIVLINDCSEEDINLKNMIDSFEKTTPNKIKKVNLRNIDVKNGCLGCLNCGYDGKCIYNDKLIPLYEKTLKEADAIVIASSIKDRYLSYHIKRFWDRSFLFGHRPMLSDKQLIYIISGELSNNQLIYDEITARANISKQNLVGIINDESDNSEDISKMIKEKSEELISALKTKKRYNENFYNISGHKIFRDFVYFSKPVFTADHKYYKKVKFYDFPQKKIGMKILMNILYLLMKIKGVRTVFKSKMKEGMIAGLKNIVEKA